MWKPKNCLAKSHPDISSDWDAVRNAPLTTDSVSATAKKRVWWTCSAGHSYETSVHSRVRSDGCKVCNQRKYSDKSRLTKLAKSISFSTARPDLLSEWNYGRNGIQPQDLSVKSGKVVWWQCVHGHQWQSAPKNRVRGHGCPVCAKEGAGDRIRLSRLRLAGISLESAHPELMSEWDFEANKMHPSKLTAKSNFRANWKCKFGHRWTAKVVNRTHNLSGCPYCTNQTSRLEIFILCELRSFFTDVEWRKKIDGIEADIYIPNLSVAIEVDGEYWHRNKLEADRAKAKQFGVQGITLIRVRHSKLPAIEGRVVLFSNSDEMLDVSKRLAKELLGLGTESSALKSYLSSKCQVNEIAYREMIARLPAPPKGDSLLDRYPEVAAQWDALANEPLSPDLFSPGSDQKIWWVCSSEHRWQATIKNRTLRHSGCPFCDREQAPSRMRTLLARKMGSIEEKRSDYLQMWDCESNGGLRPNSVAETSRYKVFWRCKNGHSFQKTPAQMKKNSSCPKCHSLEFLYPGISAEWDRESNGTLNPDEITPGSGRRVWWKCAVGHRWQTAISMRTAKKTSCPICFESRRSKNLGLTLARKAKQSLSEFDPGWLSEWQQLLNGDDYPEKVSIDSSKQYWWCCISGHMFQRSPRQRSHNEGCPICLRLRRAENIRRAKLVRSGSLYDNYPEIAAEWHSKKNAALSPRDISSNSHRRVWWICPRGHEWEQSPNYRVTLAKRDSNYVCPECARNKN